MSMAGALSPDAAIAVQGAQALTWLVAIIVLYVLLSARIRAHLPRGVIIAGVGFVTVAAPLIIYGTEQA